MNKEKSSEPSAIILKDAAEAIKAFSDEIIYKLKFVWARENAMDLFSMAELAELCCRAREVIWGEPIFLRLKAPISIVGDLHGQYEDLLGMFDCNGWPLSKTENKKLLKDFDVEPSDSVKSRKSRKSKMGKVTQRLEVSKIDPSKYLNTEKNDIGDDPSVKKYLFLGDYVDRGNYSIETVSLLLALKLSYPNRVFLLRGNHESRPVNCHYGFHREVKKRYCGALYESFQNVFNVLPFSALINDRIMCMHGGISSSLDSFDQFDCFKRPVEISDVGILTDLTWADPDPATLMYGPSPRGASYVFGKLALTTFMKQFNLQLIVRAHQVVEEGYEFFHGKLLVTIFSAPNYCGEQDNAAAILNVSDDLQCAFHIFRPASRIASKDKIESSEKNEASQKAE